MINMDYYWTEIDCPGCKYPSDVMMRDIRLEEIHFCHNCKKSIQLRDADGSVHIVNKQISETFNDIEKSLKNFFK